MNCIQPDALYIFSNVLSVIQVRNIGKTYTMYCNLYLSIIDIFYAPAFSKDISRTFLPTFVQLISYKVRENSAFKKKPLYKRFQPSALSTDCISPKLSIWYDYFTSFHSMSIWCNRANRYLKVIKTVNFVKRDAFFSMLPFLQ